MLSQLCEKIGAKKNLSAQEMSYAMDALFSDQTTDMQKAEFLQKLAQKGETDEELYMMLHKMDERAIHIAPNCQKTIIDVCGTGGDQQNTFNISTAAAFVIAASGGCVAKHGNRSVSSIMGSADIFEFFGYDLDLPSQKIVSIIEKFGIGFLFAQKFHPAMKNVAAARKLVKAKTAFNILGPLCNPANVKNQLIGVFAEEYLQRIVKILQKKGAKKIMTVYSSDGLDELSTTSKNKICFLKDGKIENIVLDPQSLGLHAASINELQVSTKHNAVKAFLSVLNGTASTAMIEITALNAAGGCIVGDISDNFDDGVELALNTIKSGKAYSHFVEFVKNCGNLQKLKEIAL